MLVWLRDLVITASSFYSLVGEFRFFSGELLNLVFGLSSYCLSQIICESDRVTRVFSTKETISTLDALLSMRLISVGLIEALKIALF